MPKWGLTEDQRRSKPWGIPEHLLLPGKTITDPVHGDIYVNRLEQAVLDSPPMQRLRRVRQLGTTHLVYPGATHTRVSHALGALRAAQDLLDAVIDNRSRPRPAADYFSEWSTLPSPHTGCSEFDRELARVTVLARLGGLLHDLNHVPFGHTIEDDLEVLQAHDENHQRLKRLWKDFPVEVRQALSGEGLDQELTKLIVSKDASGSSWPSDGFAYPFVADIVGNTICADLIDYLERDHLYSGLPIALGDRFKDEFYVSPSTEVHFPKKMVIRITRDGHERHDVTTELLKYLRYRYELSERALAHHAKLAADAMIGKLLEMRADWLFTREAQSDTNDAVAEASVHHGQDVGALRDRVREIGGAKLEKRFDVSVRAALEDDFLRYGDDGLLERMRDWGAEGDSADRRRRAVGQLADDVLCRKLFKRVGRADAPHELALAGRVYDTYGKRGPRRELEESVADWADLHPRWSLVVWLPSPKMRLKIAEVLVDDDGRINHLDRLVGDRAQDIYSAHQNLWGVSAYLSADVDPDRERRVLAYLGDRLGMVFLNRDGEPAPTVADLVVEALEGFKNLSSEDLGECYSEVKAASVAAHSGESPTFQDLVARTRRVANDMAKSRL